MKSGKWGAWAEHASCGNDQCVPHRIPVDKIQGKYFEFIFLGMIGAAYTPEEIAGLRQAANAMG